MIDLSESKVYEFDEFRLDAKSHRLFRRAGGELVPLTPKAVELLLTFVRSDGHLLTKEDLLEAIWENSFVEESNLSQTIFVLRKTLGESTKNPRFILTVPNRGYQFIAPVREVRTDDGILEENLLSESPGVNSYSKSPISNLKNEEPKNNDDEQRTTDDGQRTNLKWLVAVPLLLLSVFAVYWFYPAAKSVVAVSDVKTIAVLPFEDLSEGQTEKYLGVSLADALVNKFGNLKQLTVRPTRSVLKFTDNRADVQKIGRDLQVDAILDGRIQRINSRVRVSVQLIRTADNATIWTENFDDDFTNFFAVQDSISRKVAQSLAVRMDDSERRRFDRRGTENAVAYQDYLRGRYFWNKRTAADLQKAVGHFEQAIEKDSNYAAAYAGLADCYQLLSEYGATTPHEAFPKAKTAARKALELDDQSAEAHTALAYAQAFYDWDWTGAEASFKRALELNPNYATAHQWYAEYLVARGRFDESRARFERALEIEPVSPIILADLASLYDIQGDSERELEQARRVVEIDPNFAYGYFYLGMAYERKKMDAEASDALARTMTLFGEPPEHAEQVKEAFRKNGLQGWWKKRLEQIETSPHLRNFQSYSKALVQVRLNDKEAALKSLEQACERRDRWAVNAKYELRLEPLRQDSRFQELLRRMNL